MEMAGTTSERKIDPAGIYDGYEAWKGWSGSFAYGAAEANQFAGELRGLEVRGKTVLELGFGDGQALAWLRDQGAAVLGTEINEVFIEAGKAAGFEVHGPDLAALLAGHEGRIDRVVAFDLFEHFEIQELIQTFSIVKRLLAPDGRLIARFPNGESPFGRHYQHGDITHKSVLSVPKIRQLAALSGLEVERAGNSYRARSTNPVKRVLQELRYLARDVVSISVSAIFSIGTRNLDGNLTVVLRVADAPDTV
jgi:SAM-dependent methyltransferase